MACEAWQYNTRLQLARVFYLRLRLGGVVPVTGRDTYVRGNGRMLIRPFDLFSVEDATGAEFDTGELVTYLNDAIMFAPSMILGPETVWSAGDENAFDVALTDRGRTVSARVFLDERGAPRDFRTTDRFMRDYDAPGRPLVRVEWRTPIDGDIEVIDGHPVFTHGQAVWHGPKGPFAYADLRPVLGTLAFNVPPGE